MFSGCLDAVFAPFMKDASLSRLNIRDLNLGVAQSMHGILKGLAPIQTVRGGERSHPINSLQNVWNLDHKVSNDAQMNNMHLHFP